METAAQPLNLVLAGRLSQKAAGQTGLDTQDEDSRAWATSRGHMIVAAAADHISGRVSPFDRPKLGPWLTDPALVAMHDGILASKIDRLTRHRDWDVRQWAEKNGKKIVIAQPELIWPPEPGDLATPIIWDNLVNIAVSEWENASMRYRRMHKALLDQAFFVGKRPYGYEIVKVEGTEHKTLQPHPTQAAVVRTIFQMYLTEEWSVRQIAEFLNAKKISEPQPPKDGVTRKHPGWNDNGVRNVLRNPAAIGRIVRLGRTVLRVEPLVSVDDYRRAQSIMDARGTRKPVTQPTAMMTGILFCENGHPMYRLRGRQIPSNPNGLYYYCKECPKGERMLVKLDYVHEAVNDSIMAFEHEPHFEVKVIPGDDHSYEIDEVKQEISALDPERDDYDSELARLRGQLREFRAMPSKPAKVERKESGRTIGQVWQSLDEAGRRRYLRKQGRPYSVSRDADGEPVVVGVPDVATFQGGELFQAVSDLSGPEYPAAWIEAAQAEIAKLEREHGFRINPDGSRTPITPTSQD
jgi:site-specific DNA recombinase